LKASGAFRVSRGRRGTVRLRPQDTIRPRSRVIWRSSVAEVAVSRPRQARLYYVLPNVRSQKENVDSGIEEAGFAHPGRRRAIEFGLVAHDAAAEPSPA
jgi:hypothetical protein